MDFESRTTYIGRLRAVSATRDTFALQLDLRRVLADVRFNPPELPVSAIVCIRSLRAPLPRRLRSTQFVEAPAQEWERAVTDVVSAVVRSASRPAGGAVPAAAPAVLFADRAEMLACLARDWCEQTIWTRWWWPSLLAIADVEVAVVPAWIDAPEYVPAALDQLARWGMAGTFVSRIGSADAWTMTQRIVERRGLTLLQPIVAAFRSGHKDAAPKASVQSVQGSGPDAHIPSVSAPWSRWVPESLVQRLAMAQQCLLGIGLLVQCSPDVVRSIAFADALEHWQPRDVSGRTEVSSPAANDRSRRPVAQPIVHNADIAAPRDIPSDMAAPDAQPSRLPPDSPPKSGHDQTVHAVFLAMNVEPEDSDESYAARPPVDDTNLVAAVDVVGDRHPLTASAFSAYQPEMSRSLQAMIETELGGLFFLINLGQFLGLYGDFTTPLKAGIHLPIWDFVTLVGQRIVPAPLPQDPIWQLLAALSSRDVASNPGADFEPPNTWRVPHSWLVPFGVEGAGQWALDDNRLQVFHWAGFTIIDIPSTSDPLEQLRRELQTYAGPDKQMLVPAAAPKLSNALPIQRTAYATPLERWLGWLLPYIRARLGRALGVSEQEPLGALVCSQPARVNVTATHIDVCFALAHLPIEVRLAGLDRDPGWVPAAGRYIAFHFE